MFGANWTDLKVSSAAVFSQNTQPGKADILISVDRDISSILTDFLSREENFNFFFISLQRSWKGISI